MHDVTDTCIEGRPFDVRLGCAFIVPLVAVPRPGPTRPLARPGASPAAFVTKEETRR